MQAMLDTGLIEPVGIADLDEATLHQGAALVPEAEVVAGLDGLLALEPDGIVIATPSALHAEQSIQALSAGAAVFCQKPLGRNAAEVAAVVDTARRADRLLAVDLSYRCTEGMKQIQQLIQAGSLGEVYAIDLVFHNAYGPDKAWFYDPALSGGGCGMDLGIHLVDLALWALSFPAVETVSAELRAAGHARRPSEVEDFAFATLTLDTGTVVRLACSWRLPAGRDAIISAAF